MEIDDRTNRRTALAALVAELDEKFGRPDPTEVERFARRFLLLRRQDDPS
ncbi:hypothetical protein [Nocardioides okcheonensis]|nr:hypothetical protein [Nocardioides okcheonensis]UFN43196.1 hypothetical protein LN652_14210 [Nocardioides okcheonensis]